MIVEINDIKRYDSIVEIPQVGGEIEKGTASITMHVPSGVIFMLQRLSDDSFDRFIVGSLDEKGALKERREFSDKTEKNFFEATAYFEKLIEDKVPKGGEAPPSIGKFYFAKKATGFPCRVELDGGAGVQIAEEDVAKAFTPPQKKPFGRLDTTGIDKPEYDIIKSKFALKYDEAASKAFAASCSAALSDVAVYTMTPYSTDTGPDSDEAPDEVNDDQLSSDKIEGEDMDDAKQKEQDEKKRKGDKDGDKKDGEKGEKEDGEPGDKSDGEGEDGEEGEDKDGEESEGGGEGEDGDDGDGDDGDEGDGDGDSEGDGEGEDGGDSESGSEQDPKGGDGKNAGKKEDKGDGKAAPKVDPKGLISALEQMYETDNLAGKWKKQSRLLSSLEVAFTEAELKTIYPKLKLPDTLSKEQFIDLVRANTENIFK